MNCLHTFVISWQKLTIEKPLNWSSFVDQRRIAFYVALKGDRMVFDCEIVLAQKHQVEDGFVCRTKKKENKTLVS